MPNLKMLLGALVALSASGCVGLENVLGAKETNAQRRAKTDIAYKEFREKTGCKKIYTTSGKFGGIKLECKDGMGQWNGKKPKTFGESMRKLSHDLRNR